MKRAPLISSPQTSAAEPRGVVHETETQRQHVRVRVPGAIEFERAGHRHRGRLFDLSAGGCSFELPGHGLRAGDMLRGTLLVSLEPIGFTLPVTLQVRGGDARGARVGCRFQDMGARETGALRQLISSYLAGDAVSAGDVVRASGRASFARPRGTRMAEAPSFGGRMRALVLSLVALTAGVTAFGYALGEVHRILFVTSATAGKVAGPVYTVSMPRDGTFTSLVADDGIVRQGAPLASFEAPVLDVVRSQGAVTGLSQQQLERIMGQTVKGTITSPCDCRVQAQFAANGQYAGRGQALFELVPRELENPFILARFRFDEMDRIAPGTAVRFQVSGDPEQRAGRIAQLRVPAAGDSVGGDVVAMIEPLEPVPADLVNRPAAVDVGGLARFDPIAVVTSMASGSGNAP